MQDNELFELCKEVYKAFPDWGLHIVNGEIASYREDLRFYKNSGFEGDIPTIGNEPVYDIRYIYPVPLYTSDYLLDKLRDKTWAIRIFVLGDEFMEKRGDKFEYTAQYRKMWGEFEQFQGQSDTLIKALLKLTKALADAGELK